MEKPIKTATLPSGRQATAYETSSHNLAVEVGPNCIFMTAEDIYPFIRALKEIDKHFLKKR